ncbi:MAG: LLM class flavin-dependent oxidoreductase, partial [Gammaproteobacteria bacterium]|nr:LLM class flavin-dependent oxidoreductase [Gammaproteobacteria bacterium]
MTISAGLGIANFSFDDAAGFWEWVGLCDNGGVDSIWQSDRIISKDANLECMSVMAALAGATKNIKFGMNVASLGLRDPVITAKACATIDVLSGGRLLPAFGVGSAISRDYVATGTPTKGRGKRASEGLEILSRLWSEETVTMKGTYYQLDEASISPRPIQQPMPLWVGGSAKQAIERTARWGTGWQAGIDSADQVGPRIEGIKARTKELGRHIDEDHYGAGFGF